MGNNQENAEIKIILLDGTIIKNNPNLGKNLGSVKAIQKQLRIYGYYELTIDNFVKKFIKKEMVRSVGE